MPRVDATMMFHVDHISGVKHGGDDAADDLAFSCEPCNLHKGTDLASIDPATHRLVRLYNPREDSCDRHFRLAVTTNVGRNAMGPMTVNMLRRNSPRTLQPSRR